MSQCLYEKADLGIYEVASGLAPSHVRGGADMTTEAAVCKLMWALAQDDPDLWPEPPDHRGIPLTRVEKARLAPIFSAGVAPLPSRPPSEGSRAGSGVR